MRIKAVLAALILALIPATASAAANPYERGPAPTAASVEASRGTFAVTQAAVARQSNFGGGTVYTPTSDLTFGAVAISPGFTATQSSVAHFGPRLASYGFVVITINTLSGWDDPDSRGRQLLAALDYVVRTNPRVDASRLAVMGHSMAAGERCAPPRRVPPCRPRFRWPAGTAPRAGRRSRCRPWCSEARTIPPPPTPSTRRRSTTR
nr:hypothetical protein [Lentzea indica]